MKVKSIVLAIVVFALLMQTNHDIQEETNIEDSRFMNTTNTKCSNATFKEAGLPVNKQWLSTGAIVFADLIDSWKTASRVAMSTVTSVYNDLPGKTVLDFIDNHVMYYPKTLVRVVSALTQVSHGQIICLTIITVHHVTVPASLRDYIMLPSLVIFADFIVDVPTVTTSDFIGEFHLWNKTGEAILSYSHKLMELFVDGETAGRNGGFCANCVLDLLYSIVSVPYIYFD